MAFKATEIETDTSSSESDWEEVPAGHTDRHEIEVNYMKAQLDIPSNSDVNEVSLNQASNSDGSLKVVIPHNGVNNKSRKKTTDVIGNYIIREINKCKREVFKDMHRVGLICLLARGMQYNNILLDDLILGTALSILPAERAYPPKHLDVTYIEKFVVWFKRTIHLTKGDIADPTLSQHPPPITLKKALLEQMSKRTATSHPFLVFIFIVILRALGIEARLVLNLVPPQIKPESKDLMKLLKAEDGEKESQPSTSKCALPARDIAAESGVRTSTKTSRALQKDSKTSGAQKSTKTTRSARGTPASKKIKGAKSAVIDDSIDGANTSDSESSSDSFSERKRKKPSRATKCKSQAHSKKSSSKVTKTDKIGGTKNSKSVKCSEKMKEEVQDSKTVSPTSRKKPIENNFWAEVFLEQEQQWISVDVIEYKILSEDTVKAKATQPMCYVLSFSNSGRVKDVTTRYNDHWWTDVGKVRDDAFWMETIKPYRGRKSIHDRNEDQCLAKRLEVIELPKTVAAFKNHPRYALKRHLLKFEAIYPPDVMPCGAMRSELVYPRSSVHTLCSRETWLRQARVVRLGEKPYKTVKARPKFIKVLGTREDPQPLELFGLWQTEEYQPPVAVDGKVPRNAFGNVELFQPKMLPIGTVHLPLAGLNKIGRKLNLDCAPAVVGFEFHGGGCHPKFDGFVVCEELKDIFVEAWTQEQSQARIREEEKRLDRIYQRWAKLCQGLLIRAKLEKKYAYDFSASKTTKGKSM